MNPQPVVIVRDRSDEVAASLPVEHAEVELVEALQRRGASVERSSKPPGAEHTTPVVILAGSSAAVAREAVERAGVSVPTMPDSLALLPRGPGGVVALGADARGLAYAALELSDRVALEARDPLAAVRLDRPIVQQPANRIRGVVRLFSSDVEDLAWFRDPVFWQSYVAMLARHRFNRLHLAFGMGHDFLRNVVDAYLLFAYPFLVNVPGYHVRVPGLSEADRQSNLEALRVASDTAAQHGLHFQLGIWTQAYTWFDSPNANFVIEGLTPDNHPSYCRDAIRAILQACPSIAGVTFRVHGESGVPEGNYEFWREVFRGLTTCGRTVELDMHPKGLGPEMLEVGLATGLPLTLSPKYTAEHMGLPGHQVAIREMERTPAGEEDPNPFRDNLMNQSAGALRYTRYGNADFLREDRKYGVFYRIWPGTQRLLLWADPALAAGYGRCASFSGALGVEICEPLSFKGRRGSGLAGGREGYADADLRSDGGADWCKFELTYRLLGRLWYAPDEDAAAWRRALTHEFGAAASRHVETALAHASRVLPLVTSAHHPSAANNRFWPEMYTNMPIVDEARPHPYRDTPRPRRFGRVSPLDPGLFVGIEDFVSEALAGEVSGRISPLRVAAMLDTLAATAAVAGEQAAQASDSNDAALRRVLVDVAIQTGLGRFFAAKLRAGVAYAAYRATQNRARLEQAVQAYTAARAAWCEVIAAGRVYHADLRYGGEAWLRGHWSDRLGAIDDDLDDMRRELERVGGADGLESAPPLAELESALVAPQCEHVVPEHFLRGEPLRLELRVAAPAPSGVVMRYRHVNQAEAYVAQPMRALSATAFDCIIPGAYTDSPFPLQYFFVLRANTHAWQYPDLAPDLANQPYFLVRRGMQSVRVPADLPPRELRAE